MTNGSITDRYTLYTLIVRLLHALYWKVGRENKRKQIGILRHIVLIISDLTVLIVLFYAEISFAHAVTTKVLIIS